MLPNTRPAGPRPGFTLIELLVVIAIIGVLIGLTVAGVQKVRERGRDVQTRADLSGLEQALSQFKTKFGRNVPCFGGADVPGTSPQAAGLFRLASAYQDASGNFLPGYNATSPEVVILQQLFPRINLQDNGLRLPDYTTSPITPRTPAPVGSPDPYILSGFKPLLLDPNQLMVFFLSGGSFTGYTGFATDPQKPFKAPSTASEARFNNGPFFEFPQGRMLAPEKFNTPPVAAIRNAPANNGKYVRFSGDGNPHNQEPWFVDNYRNSTGTPYLYLSSFGTDNNYPFAPVGVAPNPVLPGFNYAADPTLQAKLRLPIQIGPWGGANKAVDSKYPVAGGDPTPLRDGGTGANAKFMNPKTWQIWCAGPNQLFGPGGQYRSAPNVSDYSDNRAGGDDFTNFAQYKLSSDQN